MDKRKKPAACLLATLASCAIVACATPLPDPEQAAVIVQPSAQSRAALQNAVIKALHRDVVRLADDALTGESILVIEPARPRDAAGLPLQGRETRPPERFRLVKSGRSCVLIYERTNERQELPQTQCAVKVR